MQANRAHLEYLTRLGDTALVLGQRLSEWCGHGPALEEELALTNVSLDLIGQARLVLSHAAALEGAGRDEDSLAYFRDESQFRNWTLAELPNGATARDDYASTIVRNFLICALQVPLWEALAGSRDETLAQIAAKSVKESRAHLRHSRAWLVRFGDGTDESHARAQAALDRLWPYTNEFWDADAVEREAAALGVGVVVAELEPSWTATVDAALSEATLRRPARSGFLSSGKRGAHSEYLGYLLAEMQVIARQHPGARW
ncbi:MAG: phenylacetate-CoA oxygenase subunit PaaC [Burkholderiaceae bacterium]|nr:phenylacetate-CoA oxygenase subunit PaaC [Burkholderiaceae bacterium]